MEHNNDMGNKSAIRRLHHQIPTPLSSDSDVHTPFSPEKSWEKSWELITQFLDVIWFSSQRFFIGSYSRNSEIIHFTYITSTAISYCKMEASKATTGGSFKDRSVWGRASFSTTRHWNVVKLSHHPQQAPRVPRNSEKCLTRPRT